MAYGTLSEYASRSVRAAAILTTGYVAGTVIGLPFGNTNGERVSDDFDLMNSLSLLITFTLGSLTDLRVKVEFSDDNTTWFQTVNGAVSSGTNTLTLMEYVISATGNYYLHVNPDNLTGAGIKARYARISVKGTGTVTSSSCAITALIGTV